MPAASNFILRGRRREGTRADRRRFPAGDGPRIKINGGSFWILVYRQTLSSWQTHLPWGPGAGGRSRTLGCRCSSDTCRMLGSGKRVSRSLSAFRLDRSGQHGSFGAHWTLKGRAPALESDLWAHLLLYFSQPCRSDTESPQKGPVFTSELEPASLTSQLGDLEHAARPLRAALSPQGHRASRTVLSRERASESGQRGARPSARLSGRRPRRGLGTEGCVPSSRPVYKCPVTGVVAGGGRGPAWGKHGSEKNTLPSPSQPHHPPAAGSKLRGTRLSFLPRYLKSEGCANQPK